MRPGQGTVFPQEAESGASITVFMDVWALLQDNLVWGKVRYRRNQINHKLLVLKRGWLHYTLAMSDISHNKKVKGARVVWLSS